MAEQLLRILVVEDNLQSAELLCEMLAMERDMNVLGVAMTGQQAVRRAAELRPDVVLMDIHLPDIDGIHATWLIASKNPDSAVIIVTSEARPDYMQRAMVAGAQGYILKPIRNRADLYSTIRTVCARALERRALLTHPGSAPPHPAPPRLGRRIALFSPKGGQGKTSVAVNLALMLRLLTERDVVLVDADLRFGDANMLLDLPYERSIVDLVPHLEQLDSDVLDQVLATHPSGLRLLMRPGQPEQADAVTAQHIEAVLTILPRLFDYVVVDCELSYDEKLLAVLDHADSILLVVTPHLGAVRNAKHFLHLADTLGYPRTKIAVVLNRANANPAFSPGDVERALGPGYLVRLESNDRLLGSGTTGVPIVQAHPRSDYACVIRQLAERIRDSADSALESERVWR
jgi:pilus assembly protein CpaE